MKILIVSDSYPPEIRSASHLMKELAEELRDRKHDVTILTCYPRYNLADTNHDPILSEVTIENGVRVIRVHTPAHHKVNFFVRGLSQLTLPYLFWTKSKPFLKDGVDCVIVYSPPLTLWKVGWYAKKEFGARFVLNVQDIFPQNAIDLGVLSNPVFIGFFEMLEKWAYETADVVTVHSEGNRQFLLSKKNIPAEKLITLHNWIEVRDLKPQIKDGPFRKKLGLEGKFVIFFGGVLGPSQGLELVIETARQVRDNQEIVFLLVGDGTEKQKLMELSARHNLNNVIFHPFISKDEYESLLKEIDVGLVCLSSLNKTPVVPGKLLSYMAAGVPALAFLNRESDGHQIIRQADCGCSAISENTSDVVTMVRKMFAERDRLADLGQNGYRYATTRFSKESCVDDMEKALK